MGVTCFNPGSFANDGTFVAYRPATREAEMSSVWYPQFAKSTSKLRRFACVLCTHVCSPGNLIDPRDDILSYKIISWQIPLTSPAVHFVPAPPSQGNSLQPTWYLHKWVLATEQVTAIRRSITSSWLLWVNHWCKGLLSCLKDLQWSGTLQELLRVASDQTFSGLGTNLSTSIAHVGIDPHIAYAWRPYKWNEWQGQHSSSILPACFQRAFDSIVGTIFLLLLMSRCRNPPTSWGGRFSRKIISIQSVQGLHIYLSCQTLD
jgi:hypothetical protein